MEDITTEMQEILEQEINYKITDKFEFNYLKTFLPLNGNGNQETEKIITGQTILLDFRNEEITITDEKKYKEHFSRKKIYGPYPYEKLGFSKDVILLIKTLLFVGNNNITTDKCLNFPKYVIANRNKIVDECIENKELENAFILWEITENNYEYEAYKDLYRKLYSFMMETYKLFLKRNLKHEKKRELFLITGPCGVGKTTISQEICKKIDKSCLINGDYMYHMINTNDTPSKDFADGSKKLKITLKNTVSLINNFLENDMNVVYEYIIFPEDLEYILDNIKDKKNLRIKFVLLYANEKTIIERNKQRDKDNSKRGVELIKIFENYNFDDKFILLTENTSVEKICKQILTNDRYIVDKEI